MRIRISKFLCSLKGTAAIEAAICFPLFIMIFYQYIGVYQNIRLLSGLERATACLGDVLVNAKPGNLDFDFMATVMNEDAEISEKAIHDAFILMLGKSNIRGAIRLAFQASSETEVIKTRFIPVNGGTYYHSLETQLDSLLKTDARNVNDNPDDLYKQELLMVHACISNPVQKFSIVTRLVYPPQYCSTFVAARRK